MLLVITSTLINHAVDNVFSSTQEQFQQVIEFLEKMNAAGFVTRPIWELMFNLPMFKDCYRDDQMNAKALRNRIVNIPSSAL